MIHSESSAYKVLVRPQLEYCSTVFCPFTDSNISRLGAVQRRAARWVNYDYGQTSSVTEISPYIGAGPYFTGTTSPSKL